VAYYRTPGGRKKREERNGARNRQRPRVVSTEAAVEPAAPAVVDEAMISHLASSTSLLEGRRVSGCEILAMLAWIWRQRSIEAGRRMDYVVRRLHEVRPDG